MSRSENKVESEAKRHIPLTTIIEGLQAIGTALELPDGHIRTIIEIVTTTQEKHAQSLSWKEWLKAAESVTFSSQSQLKMMNIAIALAFLRASGRQNLLVSSTDLDQIWSLLKDGLHCAELAWKITRSGHGSHAIPLWSLVEDGHIRELIRLHIWLPDTGREDPDFAVQEHQQFAQSWVLAGEGTVHTFDVTSAHEGNATHAGYTVSWKATKEEEGGRAYEIHSKSSTATTTGKLVGVLPRDSALRTRNMSYHIPHGVFHRIDVEPDALHATILSFDSSYGYNIDVSVLGPISQRTYTNDRKAADFKSAEIANLIEELRNWEVLHDIGVGHSNRGEWEEALRSYRTALHICENNNWLDRARYGHVTLGRIGKVYRKLGRNREACECLEQTILNTPQSRFRVDCAGELAIVYRHMDRLEDSKRAAEEQYRGAKQLNLEHFACRAIGNMGMVNYQLYLLNKDEVLLSSAISQLNERVERAQRIGNVVLEAIGCSRLSLCYFAKGDLDKAVEMALKNYDLTCMEPDTTKIGFAKAFLGRALLFAGRKDEALAVFNQPGGCSPIIALCNEISSEHRQYIVEMINAGADLKLRDEQGYSALECTVYNGDDATTEIIEQGLRAQILREGGNDEEQLTQLRYEATLRKGYRHIIQDKLRPVLLRASKDSTEATLQILRQTYAMTLADDVEKQNTFDSLKYIGYADFLRSGRLPRSNDGYAQEFATGKETDQNPFLIFMSYRVIAKSSGVLAAGFSPDDAEHTLYNRMLRVIQGFLDLHREVDRNQVGVWVDFACVDQDDMRRGIAALPMNLAQCNVMISLVDGQYYERSWCCVEVLMIQTLRKAYGIHLWYEHVMDAESGEEYLRTGPWDLDINMDQKQVAHESDRPKLLFLARQMKLLG
ncbi:hypothetical protein BCR34DRAFT_549328 [Clohesyomyces aquaticus]|uniref:Tetratricopeptide repeat protein 29 n=1 Tax=Clohesyomyces aquaticus TaxID=1231657 RepID=A0A1Y1YF73_9PLEO|nr:hypothetical protein BCR34DRAFT_549328 [Clohesyomyces aquaticus]